MEFSINKSDLKIKTKNCTLLLDPQSVTTDIDVILLSQNNQALKDGNNLIIKGPGEYEISGVSIKGENSSDGVIYDISDDAKHIIILPSAESAKDKDTEGYDAAIVFAKNEINADTLSNVSANIIVTYGDTKLVKIDKSSLKTMDKLNLKKIEDLKGSVIFLNK